MGWVVVGLLLVCSFFIDTFCFFIVFVVGCSDVEDDGDEGEKEDGDDEEDFGGPMPGDDGMGPLAARKYFEEKKKELGGSLSREEVQDEGEEPQSAHYKIVQWNHRTIRELYRTIQVLRQKREEVGAKVREQMIRKGLA